MFEQLRPHLFPGDGTNTYAILDGASIPDLLDKLDECQPEYVCLYAGELEPDVEECAPYLVRLDPDSEFTRWVIDEGWGKHWGIFATSPADLRAMRKHFRTFLLVKDPEGKTLYFRYYDPRVLAIYLPATNANERESIFGEVSAYFFETGDAEFVACRRRGSELERQKCLAVASAIAH